MRGITLVQNSLLIALLAAAAAGMAQTSPSGSAPAILYGSVTGDPAAGKAIFNGAGKCLSCHQVGASGSVVGRNLSNIGAELTPVRLRQWLLDPPQQIEPQDRLYEIVTSSGKIIRGKLLNQGPFSLQILQTDGQLLAVSRSQVKIGRFVDPPPMPSYKGKLSDDQIDNIVAYLASLRAPANN